MGDPRKKWAWQKKRAEVLAASNWICAWCHLPINPNLPGNHRMGATVDHGVELCDGGDLLNNTFTVMHSACNSKKHAEKKRRQKALNPSRRW